MGDQLGVLKVVFRRRPFLVSAPFLFVEDKEFRSGSIKSLLVGVKGLGK